MLYTLEQETKDLRVKNKRNLFNIINFFPYFSFLEYDENEMWKNCTKWKWVVLPEKTKEFGREKEWWIQQQAGFRALGLKRKTH